MQIGSTSPVAAVLNEGHSSINTESTDRFGRQPATHSPRLRTALIVAGLCAASYSQAAVHRSERRLRQSFTAPPDSARPWVWWHWINGNVTEEGIGLDLEWMSRVGIHGIVLFEGSIDTPQIVPKRLVYGTPVWKHDDGLQYRLVTDISLSSIAQRTVAFPAVTAKFLRVIFPEPKATATATTTALPLAVTELVLSPAARINEFEKRAGYARARRFKYAAIHCRRDTKAEASKCRQLKVVTVLELTAAIKAGETAVSNSSGHAFFGGNVDEILLHRFVEI